MTDLIFIKPFLALILTAATSSLLGVFVLWKRLSYFGDAISHSILLGASLGAILSLEQNFSLVFFALIFAALVGFLSQNRYFSKDTIITISSYFCVALAIILNDLSGQTIDFSNYIFGDISSVATLDIAVLAAILVATILFVTLSFKKILLINLASDLAKVEGIKTSLWNNAFLILLTLAVAMSVKVVGVLLVTALLVLPAAIARLFSKSATQMIFFSAANAIAVCALSQLVANQYQISVAALTVLISSSIFILILLAKNVLK